MLFLCLHWKIVVFRRDWQIITIFWISILSCPKRVIWEIRTEFCFWWCQREGNNGEPERGGCFVQGTNEAAYLVRTLLKCCWKSWKASRPEICEDIDKKRCIPFLDGTRNKISEIYVSWDDVFICLKEGVEVEKLNYNNWWRIKSHQLLDNLRFSIPNK